MKRFFSVYQFVVPLALAPASYWLWLGRYGGDHRMALMTLAVPVIFAYIVPGIGTNVLKLWEFDTRLRWGRFRPHHGFVFGSGAALLAFISTSGTAAEITLPGVAQQTFIVGSIFAFWNWLYDAHAIRAGFIRIHVQPFIPEKAPAGIAMEHAPVVFGGFGAAYALWLIIAQSLMDGGGGDGLAWLLLFAGIGFVILVPTGGFVLRSYLKYGESGLRPLGDIGYYQPGGKD